MRDQELDVQLNVQREKESMVRYDKEGVDSIDFNYGMWICPHCSH
jgi:uncharacterized protein (UPF0212 family)